MIRLLEGLAGAAMTVAFFVAFWCLTGANSPAEWGASILAIAVLFVGFIAWMEKRG